MKFTFARRHPFAITAIALSLSVIAGAESWVGRGPEVPASPAPVGGPAQAKENAPAVSTAPAKFERNFARSETPERVFQAGPFAGAVIEYSPVPTQRAAEPITRVVRQIAQVPPLSLAPLPLAFQIPEYAATNETAKAVTPQHQQQQEEALAQLQQDFVNAIGGPNQDPSDPAYLQRWQRARRDSDEQFRLLVGNSAFLAFQAQTNGD